MLVEFYKKKMIRHFRFLCRSGKLEQSVFVKTYMQCRVVLKRNLINIYRYREDFRQWDLEKNEAHVMPSSFMQILQFLG
jgi:hypothetical protein